MNNLKDIVVASNIDMGKTTLNKTNESISEEESIPLPGEYINEINNYYNYMEDLKDIVIYGSKSRVGIKYPSKKYDLRMVPMRTTPKMRRNEPCNCGSGKKNKNCCKK